MKMLAVCCLLLSALCLRAELAFKWTVEVSQPLPYAAEALQGETFNLEAKMVQYRVPLLEAAEATFYYQTPEMEASQWYTVPAAWDATTATASVAFMPAMDVGSTKYRFFFGIETAQGKNYRVFGTLRLKASPGFSPATLTPTDVRAEIIQEILEAVFEESDERYATKAEHAALAVQVQGKADASHTHTISQVTNLQTQLDAKAATSTVSALTTRLTAAEAAIEEVAEAKQDKLTIDSTLSASSTNPVQNKVVYSALQNRMTWSDMYGALSGRLESGDSPYSNDFDALFGGYEAFREQPATLTVSSSDQGGVLGFTEINGTGYIAWKSDKDGQRRKYALGGGNTEVWKGNVGFGDQDTFIGAKRTADGDGQFLNGYPRLHNHGQDIHEVSGFSRDSRDDETVWSHRLLLPWDLAKANDTSYLMAGVVWNGKRRILNHPDYGLETTFVQPLIPENTGGTKSYGLTHAIPCFENSPMYWNGNIIYNDSAMLDSGVPAEATKAVIVPWERVTGTVESPTELALKSDIPSIDAALSATSVNPVQNKAVKTALDTKQDKLTAGENITISADGTISASGGDESGSVTMGQIGVGLGGVGISDGVFFFGIDDYGDENVFFKWTYTSDASIVPERLVPTTKVTDALASRVTALESGGGDPVAREGHAIAWQANTSLLTVTPNADGAVVFDPMGWPEGQSLLVRLTTPEDFGGVPASVRLVGYFDIEPASTYQLTAYVVGGTLHVVPLLREE